MAGTLERHIVVAINMAMAITSTMSLDSQKAKNGMDPAIKAIALILAILLRKLKTHVVRKKYTIKIDSDEENL